MSVWQKTTEFLAGFKRKTKITEPTKENEVTIACCSEEVHIAFRGVSDDRLYIAYNRKWDEVRYYKPNGLRVFCAGCRHRVL